MRSFQTIPTHLLRVLRPVEGEAFTELRTDLCALDRRCDAVERANVCQCAPRTCADQQLRFNRQKQPLGVNRKLRRTKFSTENRPSWCRNFAFGTQRIWDLYRSAIIYILLPNLQVPRLRSSRPSVTPMECTLSHHGLLPLKTETYVWNRTKSSKLIHSRSRASNWTCRTLIVPRSREIDW